MGILGFSENTFVQEAENRETKCVTIPLITANSFWGFFEGLWRVRNTFTPDALIAGEVM